MTEIPIWIYMCVYGFIALLFTTIGLVAGWVIWEKWVTPQESKIIRKAKRKKKPLVIHVGDEGFAKFEVLDEIGKEGYAQTTEKKDKEPFIGFLPRTPPEEKVKNKVATFINKLAEKKAYLPSAKVPIWFAYTGKSILTSLYPLAGLKILEETNPGSTVVNLQEIKSLFDKPWDQTQIRALTIKAHTRGMLEQKKFMGIEGWKPVIMGVSIILALGIILVLVLVLAPRVL